MRKIKETKPRYHHKFTEEEHLQVVKSYLVDSLSHRAIQTKILGLPEIPGNGGGFVAMDILHLYGIKGDQKGILKKNSIDKLISSASGDYKKILIKLKEMFRVEKEVEKIIINPGFKSGKSTEVKIETIQRIGQNKLREYTLKSYGYKCALCEIDKEDLLVCSHIVPWRDDEVNRLNPENTICLCAMHDKMFDKGYFSLDEKYNIVLGKKADDSIRKILDGCKFRQPAANKPSKELLKNHYEIYCK